MSVCATEGCGQTVAARVTLPHMPESRGNGLGFVIVRPAHTPVEFGEFMCLDCAHAAVDDMLMAAMPPGPGPELEQRPDGAQ
jgi:hypothetical protein